MFKNRPVRKRERRKINDWIHPVIAKGRRAVDRDNVTKMILAHLIQMVMEEVHEVVRGHRVNLCIVD